MDPAEQDYDMWSADNELKGEMTENEETFSETEYLGEGNQGIERQEHSLDEHGAGEGGLVGGLELVEIQGEYDPDYPDVVELFKTEFGDMGLERRHLENRALILAVKDGEEIVAVSACLIRKEGGREKYLRKMEQHGVLIPKTDTLGELTQAVVKQGWRRKGLASWMVQVRLDWLAEHGCDGVVVESWQHPGKDQANHVLERAGMTRLGYVSQIWNGEWSCPYHGLDDTCGGVIYWKAV